MRDTFGDRAISHSVQDHPSYFFAFFYEFNFSFCCICSIKGVCIDSLIKSFQTSASIMKMGDSFMKAFALKVNKMVLELGKSLSCLVSLLLIYDCVVSSSVFNKKEGTPALLLIPVYDLPSR